MTSSGFWERIACALVLVAHPDDETLLCGGALARLSAGGARVAAVSLTDGGQGRDVVMPDACRVLGASCEILAFSAGRVRVDPELVATIDGILDARRPDLVLTHSATRRQHQDHVAVHDGVSLALSRRAAPIVAIGAEPPVGAQGFAPNVFIDVSAYMAQKYGAARIYRRLLDRE